MNIINLISKILNENIFEINFKSINNDNIIINLLKIVLLTSIIGIIININFIKISLFVLSVVIILYTLEKYNKIGIKSETNNKYGNYILGKDKKIKEINDKTKLYDTIHLHYNDLVNKNILHRNFYRLPNPRKLNNQKQFGKWLYYKKKTCKETNSKCFKNELLNNR